jgi:hypothetical protein
MSAYPIEHHCHFGTVAVVKIEAPQAVEKERRSLFVEPPDFANVSAVQYFYDTFGTSDECAPVARRGRINSNRTCETIWHAPLLPQPPGKRPPQPHARAPGENP